MREAVGGMRRRPFLLSTGIWPPSPAPAPAWQAFGCELPAPRDPGVGLASLPAIL